MRDAPFKQKGARPVVLFCAALMMLGFAAVAVAKEARIKDLVQIKGNRPNQLIGFGLVVGLAGTGDSPKSLTTNQAVASMLSRLGMISSPEAVLTQSVAAVVVTAELPAFAKNGDRIDVKASVVGDAKSLGGGTLLMTQLKAGDGQVYAVAQGPIVLGQITGANSQTPTAAYLPGAAFIEREFTPNLVRQGAIDLSLKQPDFTTNSRVADAINAHFKGFYAKSLDPSLVRVELPPLYHDQVIEFVAELEALRVDTDMRAVVVLNERTGTVVMGAEVVIDDIVISHGDLSIQVGNGKDAKQQTVVSMRGSTVGDLVQSLNALGIRPPDLVGILQSIHAAGALRGDLKIL